MWPFRKRVAEPEPVCPAHGRTLAEHGHDDPSDCNAPPFENLGLLARSKFAECADCSYYGGIGMHGDTCPQRGQLRGLTPPPLPYVPGGPVSAPPIFDAKTALLVQQWKREAQIHLDADAAAQARRREDAAQLAEAITERILDKLGPIIDALTEGSGPRLSRPSHPSSAERPTGGGP